MKWKKLQVPSKVDWKEYQARFEKEHGFKYTRKPRFFIDENFGQGTTELLRKWVQTLPMFGKLIW